MRRTTLSLLALVVLATPVRAADDPAAVAAVKKMYAEYEKVLNTDAFLKDPTLVFPYYDIKNMRLFDAMPPEDIQGDDFARHWIRITLDFPTRVKFTKMEIHAGVNVAFVSYIQHFKGRQKEGPPFDMRTPTTDFLVNSGGKWRIVHQHAHQPVTPETFMTMLAKKQKAAAK